MRLLKRVVAPQTSVVPTSTTSSFAGHFAIGTTHCRRLEIQPIFVSAERNVRPPSSVRLNTGATWPAPPPPSSALWYKRPHRSRGADVSMMLPTASPPLTHLQNRPVHKIVPLS